MELKVTSSFKLLIALLFSFLLTACGGSSDSNDSDSSYSASHTSEAGVVYQCDTESAYDSCSGSDEDCSACTSSTDGTDTDNSGDTCEVDGRNVTVPNNSSCVYSSHTATCTDGTLNYRGLVSGGAINMSNVMFNGELVDFRMACGE